VSMIRKLLDICNLSVDLLACKLPSLNGVLRCYLLIVEIDKYFGG
jgi:hypothetical protein